MGPPLSLTLIGHGEVHSSVVVAAQQSPAVSFECLVMRRRQLASLGV